MKITGKLILTILYIFLITIKTSALTLEDSINVNIANRGYFSVNGLHTHIIELKITNTAQSETNFWILSCDVAKHIVFLSDKYKLILPNCNSNYPILIKLRPEESVCFNILIGVKDESCDNYNFTIGFIFVSENDYDLRPGNNFYDVIDYCRIKKEQVIYYKDFNILTHIEQPIFNLYPK
jgi:hypothetical protein